MEEPGNSQSTAPLHRKASGREFAREVFVGVGVLTCLFAIFLFVSLQKATGKNLSPLAYLWNDPPTEPRKPVVVFRTEQDRREALENYSTSKPKLDELLAKFNESTKRLREKREKHAAIRRTKNSDRNSEPQKDSATVFGTASGNDFSVPNRRSFQPAPTIGTQAKSRRLTSDSGFQSGVQQSSFNVRTDDTSRDKQTDPTRAEIPATQSAGNQRSVAEDNSATKPAPPTRTQTTSPPQSFLPPESPESLNTTATVTRSNPETSNSRTASPVIPTVPSTMPGPAEKKKELTEAAIRVHPRKADSYWTISEKYYGSGRYFRELALFNGAKLDQQRLPDPVLVPPLSQLKQWNQESETARQTESNDNFGASKTNRSGTRYETVEGDTLFGIAAEKLGSAGRYVELLRLNRSRLPQDCRSDTRLPAGLEIRLPHRK